MPFSDASLPDFQVFMREIGPRARPSLFLGDNGNLRALWKNDRREQIGLEFLSEGNIPSVIFKERKGALKMARDAGVDAKDKILEHIKASEAEGLLLDRYSAPEKGLRFPKADYVLRYVRPRHVENGVLNGEGFLTRPAGRSFISQLG